MLQSIASGIATRPWTASLCVAALVCVFPAVDLWMSAWFFDDGSTSWMPRSNLMQFARSGLPPIIIGGLLFVLILWAAGRLLGQGVWNITGRKAGYLLISLTVGPGLLVESVLKVYSGRARPRDVMPFGGDDPFTPALWLADACERNCSFVSGHAALAFWVTAFAFLFPVGERKPVLICGIGLGLLMGLARMAEGAHFFSDVVFAGLVVVGTNVVLAHVMLESDVAVEVGHGS